MNAAITAGKAWKSANTEVEVVDGVRVVKLHGHKIAEIGDNFLRLFDGGWQSNTTKSRLNAILAKHGMHGERIFQKQWEWFINLQTPNGLQTVPFFSSMKLGDI